MTALETADTQFSYTDAQGSRSCIAILDPRKNLPYTDFCPVWWVSVRLGQNLSPERLGTKQLPEASRHLYLSVIFVVGMGVVLLCMEARVERWLAKVENNSRLRSLILWSSESCGTYT